MSSSHSRSTGFTLIELLVVVVIISISIGFVVVNFSAESEEDIVKNEIIRLQQILRFAHQQSVIRAEEYGVRFYQTGYRFMRFDEENKTWIDVDKDKLLRYRLLPSPLELNLYIEQTPIELLESAENDPKPNKLETSSADNDTTLPKQSSSFITQQADSYALKPQVFLLSSTELTPPFELSIRIPGSEIEAHLNGLPQGIYQQPASDE